MMVEITGEQATALRLLGWWWACINADRELSGDPVIAPESPVLHYVANGATAVVTAANLTDLAAIATEGTPHGG